MTLTGAIVVFGPLSVFGVLICLLAVGLAWSPFGALTVWYLARRRGLSGGHFAMVGGAYSIFLLIPWLRLVYGLNAQRSPGFVGPLYLLLYFAWMVGPILFWGQYVVGMDIFWLGHGPDETLAPGGWLGGYSVFVVMTLTWLGSAVTSLKIRTNTVYPPLTSSRYIIPFALTWICTLAVGVYWFL